jgi:two-component system sensor histidine kinase DesK
VLAIGGLKALIVALQLVHSLPRLRPVRLRYWKWTFTVQALLSFLPFFALGSPAIAGGNLAGSALLLFRRSVAWTWFGLILATEIAILAATHAGADTITLQVVDGSVVIALATYALTRLTDVISELRATRTAMARATAREERLRAARDVFGAFGTQLSSLADSAEQARRRIATQPDRASQKLAELAAGARQALAQARTTSSAFRKANSGGGLALDSLPAVRPEPRLAFAIVVVMSITGAAANLAAIVGTRTSLAAAALAWLAALVALEVYHGAPRSDGALPRGGQWTLTAQLLLVYLPIPLFGTNWSGMASYFAACALVALRPPKSWVLFAAVTASLPVIATALSEPVLTGVDFVLGSMWTVLIFYGPMRLATLALELRSARAELARVMLVQARLDVARDVHDVLGSSLAAAALKADLACRLLRRDPTRVDAELADVTALAHRAVAEALGLSRAETGTTLAEEIASTRSILAAAGVETSISTTAVPGGLPAPVDRALAVVIREAVTNVLRHSHALRCAITMRVDAGVLRLEVTNDGVPTPAGTTPGGSGISNLTARIQAITGTLTANGDGPHGFTLVAEVPLASQSAGAGSVG